MYEETEREGCGTKQKDSDNEKRSKGNIQTLLILPLCFAVPAPAVMGIHLHGEKAWPRDLSCSQG